MRLKRDLSHARVWRRCQRTSVQSFLGGAGIQATYICARVVILWIGICRMRRRESDKKAFGSVKRTAARASRPGAVIHRQVRAGRSGVNNEQPPPPSSDGLSEVRSPLMVSRARKFSVVCLHPRRIYKLARPHAGAMYSRRPAALTLPHGGRPEAGIRCGRRPAAHASRACYPHILRA